MMPPRPLSADVLAALPALRGCAWDPLSGGRTNQVWRVGTVVVKAYDSALTSPLFPNDPGAEARALALLGPIGLSPRLVGAGEGWVAYAHLTGAPWQGDPTPVAEALHRLHQLSGKGFRPLASGSAALLAQGKAILLDCCGKIPPPPPDPCIPPIRAPRLIHGDAVPGNLIAGTGGVVPIDWQCPASGDPSEDLATFLSPAMQWLYGGVLLDEGQIAAFRLAYPDHTMIDRLDALAPLYRWRMAAHCLWKAERGAPDYATALDLELDGVRG